MTFLFISAIVLVAAIAFTAMWIEEHVINKNQNSNVPVHMAVLWGAFFVLYHFIDK